MVNVQSVTGFQGAGIPLFVFDIAHVHVGGAI